MAIDKNTIQENEMSGYEKIDQKLRALGARVERVPGE